MEDSKIDLLKANVIRFDNKLYLIRKVYTIVYFHEYYSYKNDNYEFGYEFYIDINKKEFNNLDNAVDDKYKEFMFNKILKEGKAVQEEEIEKEFMECLWNRYQSCATRIISSDEIQEREVYHATIFKNIIKKYFNCVANNIYVATSKGFTQINIKLMCSENNLTSHGKYPVIYSMPQVDGTFRKTFEEYLYYIVLITHTEFDEKCEIEISDKERIGIILSKKLQSMYPSLIITYIFAKEFLPILQVCIPELDKSILS